MSGPRSALSKTTAAEASERAPTHGAMPEVSVLAIVWSTAEAARVGEIAVLADAGAVTCLGRGVSEEGAEPRVRFYRQRPGALAETEPLASPVLSRRQLLVHPSPGGARLERVGKASLDVNGERVETATIAPGDVVTLGRELVLLCARRPALIPSLRAFPKDQMPAFGAVDASGILGESPAVWAVREAIAFAAKTDRHALILGESGTGKELAARAIHTLSSRAKGRFVARNAATLPAGLVDAELFGNAKNYPNPGMPERAGLIGEADGGTLFLDEIGELPVELQAHLLRVLDSDGEYQRLGDGATRRSSFRLVAATNRDPAALKHDLAARLAINVSMPSLEMRREDIPLLAQRLLLLAAESSLEMAGRFVVEAADGVEHARFAAAFVRYLVQRKYPTNVRELDAVVWRAIAESRGDVLEPPPEANERERASEPPAGKRAHIEEAPAAPPPRPEPTADEIRAALAASDGKVPSAARALGLQSRYALYRLMKKHGIG